MGWVEAASKWYDIDANHKHCQKLPKAARSKSVVYAKPPPHQRVLTIAGWRTMGTPWAKNTFQSTYSADFAGRQNPSAESSNIPATASQTVGATGTRPSLRQRRSHSAGNLRAYPYLSQVAD